MGALIIINVFVHVKESGWEIPEVPPTEASVNDLDNFEDFIGKHSDHFEKYGVMKVKKTSKLLETYSIQFHAMKFTKIVSILQIIPPSNWNPIMKNFDFVNDEYETFEVSFHDLLKSELHDRRYYIYESAKKRANL